ncbi:MAG: hypothetical protein ACFFD2_28660 [Promethearchaeota archaeon]
MDPFFQVMMVTAGFLLGALIFFYIVASSFIQKQFALCQRCGSMKFDRSWKQAASLRCNSCKISMRLINIPGELWIRRVENIRIYIVYNSPFSISPILFHFSIWLGLAFVVPFLIYIFPKIYYLEKKFREDVRNWVEETNPS